MKKTMTITPLSILSVVTTLLLTGCFSSEEHSDLKTWIKGQEQTVRARVEPLPRNLDYTAIPFEGAPSIDPFKSRQLKIVIESQKEAKPKMLPEKNRRKEPLESFNLTEMTINGLVSRDGKTYAIIKTARDNIVHTVGLGNYIGPNYGKIIKIEPDKIVLREIILTNDEWVEKNTDLLLEDASTKSVSSTKNK